MPRPAPCLGETGGDRRGALNAKRGWTAGSRWGNSWGSADKRRTRRIWRRVREQVDPICVSARAVRRLTICARSGRVHSRFPRAQHRVDRGLLIQEGRHSPTSSYPMKRLLLILCLVLSASPWLRAEKLSADELKLASDHLKKTSAALLAATSGLSAAQW